MYSNTGSELFDREIPVAQRATSHRTFSQKLQAEMRDTKARFWMVVSALGMLTFAGVVAGVSYNTRPLTTPQVTAMLLAQPADVRRLAIADMQADYGINALGDPITRFRVLEAISTAKDRVEYDHLVVAEKAASTESRSMLDTVSASVERVK